MFGGSPWELFVVLGIVLLFFGSRLPKLMFSLGKSVTEFKKGISEKGDDETESIEKKNQDSLDEAYGSK